jgi:SAM-dependent methyltransferase
MQSLYDEFLPLITKGGFILDAGCGSGRDTKYFIDNGYKACAFDACPELCRLASELIKQPVQQALFQTFESTHKFDGIWACASLLHVPADELSNVISKFISLLTETGVFYCSFKLGREEVFRNGRVFTNLDESSFEQYIKEEPISIVKQWRTGDLREGRESEQWLNVILRREAVYE